MSGVKDHLRHLRGGGKALPHRTGRVASEVGGIVDVDLIFGFFWLLFASFIVAQSNLAYCTVLVKTCKTTS